jgi:hypothetical protein
MSQLQSGYDRGTVHDPREDMLSKMRERSERNEHNGND